MIGGKVDETDPRNSFAVAAPSLLLQTAYNSTSKARKYMRSIERDEKTSAYLRAKACCLLFFELGRIQHREVGDKYPIL